MFFFGDFFGYFIFIYFIFLNKLWEILQKRHTLEGIRVVLAGGRHQTISFSLFSLKETVEIGYRFFIFLPAEESQKINKKHNQI